MLKKLIAFASASLLFGFIAFAAQAAETQDYNAKAFAEAQAAGRPILVEIHASWCPTCKAQLPILGELEKQDKLR